MALVKPTKTAPMTEAVEQKEVVQKTETVVEQNEVVKSEVVEQDRVVEAAEQVQVEQSSEVVTEDVVEDVEHEDVVEQTQVEDVVETETVEVKTESKEVAVAETKNTSVAVSNQDKKLVGVQKVIAEAEDEGFAGLEFGFGSFPMIKLANEGNFVDLDDQSLGKHIRATLVQSSPIFMYVQDGNDDGDIAYSYDQDTVHNYKGNDGEDLKTVRQVVAAWEQDGYETVEKKYLEVVATVHEDSSEYLEGEIPEALLDLEGQTVMLRLSPASIRAFSGCIHTLRIQKKPMAGAVMDFKVGPKRDNGKGKKYYPWKFLLVK